MLGYAMSPRKKSKLTADGMVVDMTRDLTSDQKKFIKPKLRIALPAFGPRQLARMQKAGVRVWPGSTSKTDNGVPPPFRYKDGKTWIAPGTVGKKNHAKYDPGTRVIFYHTAVKVDDMRHELAHAWDNVRMGGKLNRYDDIKEDSDKIKTFEKAMFTDAREVMWSASNAAVNAAFTLYQATYKTFKSDQCFDHPITRTCHSVRSVGDFYAEAYSVFHGTNSEHKAKMRKFMPQIFAIIEKEAKSNGLAVPHQSRKKRQRP
jgi:hypothetical protein